MKKLYRYTVVMNDDEVINLWSKSKEMESINDTWLYFEKTRRMSMSISSIYPA